MDLETGSPMLPERCAVLIIGAGPAGSAAARVLGITFRSLRYRLERLGIE